MEIFHLAKKAEKKIPLYELPKARVVNVPFSDEILNKTRYLVFYRREDSSWGFIGAEDNPAPTH